jgi:hypothetical protein
MKVSVHKFNPRALQHALLGGVVLAAMAVTGAHAATGEPMPMKASMFEKVDTNHDGMISAEEFKASGMQGKLFAKADHNHDGMLNSEEFVKAEAMGAAK